MTNQSHNFRCLFNIFETGFFLQRNILDQTFEIEPIFRISFTFQKLMHLMLQRQIELKPYKCINDRTYLVNAVPKWF